MLEWMARRSEPFIDICNFISICFLFIFKNFFFLKKSLSIRVTNLKVSCYSMYIYVSVYGYLVDN